ncbi:hypothetical protein PMAYCL1PPCAC_16055 [Pristionchus mayeri]|uniref:24 kDa family member n=1 Tax=Pristionchus mayeri TaxID=1317129 RepID=A0AAN5CK15_9BILA|nr:hypothetical protein PMAYCL1PPCAC_16055 [Pristionchus mayeri]
MTMYALAAVALLCVCVSGQQMQNQCLCSDVNPCIDAAPAALEQCADKCKSFATDMGASIPKLRQCGEAHLPQIMQGIECMRAKLENVCAAAPGAMVPRRFPETFQLAAFRELNAGLQRSGLLQEAQSLIQTGKKALGCMVRCGEQHNCAKKLHCGLALPADNVIIGMAKTCAFQAGLSTPVAREVCGCLVNAGLKVLAPMCPKIIIS